MNDPAITLDAPDTARSGETIVFEVVLANHSSSPIDTHLQGRDIIFDVMVSDESGNLVWHRLAGVATQAILRLDTFAPGETRRFTCKWDQRGLDGSEVRRGAYVAQALVPTEADVLASTQRVLTLT